MVVCDESRSLQITGTGDVLEPHDGIIAIGSGGPYALAAARALIDIPGLDAMTIAKKAMTIAANSCIYTNHAFTIDSLVRTEKQTRGGADARLCSLIPRFPYAGGEAHF